MRLNRRPQNSGSVRHNRRPPKRLDSTPTSHAAMPPPDDAQLLRNGKTKIAKEIYRAKDVILSKKVKTQISDLEKNGFSKLPICMAKTQYSFSTDPTLKNAPVDHDIEIRELRLSAGAGFIVAISGDIMTMPGLPRKPAAENIYLDRGGNIEGLF